MTTHPIDGWPDSPEFQAMAAAEDVLAGAQSEREVWAAGLADLLIPKLHLEAVAAAMREMTDDERKELGLIWFKAGYPVPKRPGNA